jgi:hypothetical protein
MPFGLACGESRRRIREEAMGFAFKCLPVVAAAATRRLPPRAA